MVFRIAIFLGICVPIFSCGFAYHIYCAWRSHRKVLESTESPPVQYVSPQHQPNGHNQSRSNNYVPSPLNAPHAISGQYESRRSCNFYNPMETDGANNGEAGRRGGMGRGGPRQSCVVCGVLPQHAPYPTCGLTCAAKLQGSSNDSGSSLDSPQASDCCLLCHSEPKIGNHDFCGKTCRRNASSKAPFLMEVPSSHVTFKMVQTKFSSAWNCPMGRPCPPLKKVFKIVESPVTRAQYKQYKSEHGNEVFRYHGTSRECSLGETDNRYPCSSNTCRACSILNTSFRVSLADPGAAFGQAIYTSSASNKSSRYSPEGVMFLAKVVLGRQYFVSDFAEVKSLPSGYNSVVFDRLNGRLNESVVYENTAIRPVFLIIFST